MKIKLLLLIALTSLVNCNKENYSDISTQVVNDFYLSEETKNYLFTMYPNIVDNPYSDELAFSNTRSPIQLVTTDYSGELIEVIGSEGRGPGEIQSARYFGYDKEQNIVVDDKRGSIIKRYNRSSDEVTAYDSPARVELWNTTRNMQMCNDFWYLGVLKMGEKPFPDVPVIGKFNQEFKLIDLFGGYDPFFEGRTDIMQETALSIDCENDLIYTVHGKTPYIQVYEIENQQLIHRISNKPENFMLSSKFFQMAGSTRQMLQYLAEEQSTSILIAYSESYIYHIYRNAKMLDTATRGLNDRIYYAAIYDKDSYNYLGETELDGAILGFTKNGYLIMVKDEEKGHIQFVDITVE